MFLRRATDGTRIPMPLENQFAGPTSTPCWIIGAGPSLNQLAADQIVNSPAPRFCINLAGSGLLRPHFWTSYDPTARFHRSIYLDPGVMKFVHEGRAMDLVPETTFKVCDSPSLYLIDRERQRGFHDFPGTGTSPVTDWQDSLIQAIEIAFRLGFRELYLVGCEMTVRPSPALLKIASGKGVRYQPRELLGTFIRRCEEAGLARRELEELSTDSQYHFDEQKSLTAAIQTDAHYFRIVQTLRLCRRSMALAGLQLHSVTPRSRLNADFPCLSVAQACQRIQKLPGDPRSEQTRGRYSENRDRRPKHLTQMRDVRPHFWPVEGKGAAAAAAPVKEQIPPDPHSRLLRAIDALPEIPIDVHAEG
ncbi:hypothetical protein SH661x_003997 [Planctomicrobium sp. SH661]|uniref:hypothetical protein n=1 Tax=Planctomicrobium sp. SH661 TaxID=3448124 RepID=UPI003F5C7EDD